MPVTGQENIFEALFKWGEVSSKEENFYSKSLILVLKRLERHDKTSVKDFLNYLFSHDARFRIISSQWDITNHTGVENKPDIEIEADDTLSYIEVKVSKPLEEDQLRRYRNDVNKKARKTGKSPHLFAITRFGTDYDWNKCDRQTSWIRVWQCLGRIEHELEPKHKELAPEAYYLLRDFRLFLKEKGMGAEQLSQIASSESLHDVRKLLSLILAGCKAAGLKGEQCDFEDEGSKDDSCFGWWFKEEKKGKQYWCGFYMNQPMKLAFGLAGDAYKRLSDQFKKKPNPRKRLDKRYKDWWMEEKEEWAEFPLYLPDDFVRRRAEQQVSLIPDFVSELLDNTIERRKLLK